MGLIKKKKLLLNVLCVTSSGLLQAGDIGSSYTSSDVAPQEFVCPFSLVGEALFWTAQVSGLENNFGSNTIIQSMISNISNTIVMEKDMSPHFHWNVGYRVAFGCQFNSSWMLDGVWTSFASKGVNSANDGKWKVRLKQADVLATYNAYINPSFVLQSFIGARGASIHEKLHSQVVMNVEFVGTGVATDTKTFKDHQKFLGIGPLFGFQGDLKAGKGFGFYGGLSAALLYGTYHLSFNDTEVVTEPATPSFIISIIKKHMVAFDFNVGLELGIRWRKHIYDACCLEIKLGGENLQYFNQSRLGTNYGDLSFSGGVLALNLEF